MVYVARTFCNLCLWALWVLSTVYKPEQRLYLYEEKQRQRHFGGKNALLTHRGHPCLSLSKLCLHIPQELKRAEQLWYMVWAALLKKERTHFHLYTRERTVGKKYVCPSRITVLKAFLLPCWKWPYHAGILELWRVKWSRG